MLVDKKNVLVAFHIFTLIKVYLACRVKVGLKKIFVNFILITYFYYTKVLQIS